MIFTWLSILPSLDKSLFKLNGWHDSHLKYWHNTTGCKDILHFSPYLREGFRIKIIITVAKVSYVYHCILCIWNVSSFLIFINEIVIIPLLFSNF